MKTGDIVKLATGGPSMVIVDACENSVSGEAIVAWFDENEQLHHQNFPRVALVCQAEIAHGQ